MRDDLAAAAAALRAQVHQPVGSFNHIKVVLDHDDRIALISEVVQHRQQLFDVMKMQPGGRFIQDVERLTGIALAEFPGQFDPLGFAPPTAS